MRLRLLARFGAALRLDFAAGLRAEDFFADDFRADDFFAEDFFAEDLRAGPLELDFRAPPAFLAAFFPRAELLRAGADFRPPLLFFPPFEPPRDDFLAAIFSSSNVGVLLRHYSNFRAQKTTGVLKHRRSNQRELAFESEPLHWFRPW